MSQPTIVIIGRTNVGKSTLFNRLIQRRHAIVDKQERITRDRIYGQADWRGYTLTIVDTGGFIPDEVDSMDAAVRHQVELAMAEADFLLFMVDGRQGILPPDLLLADAVRQSAKPHLLVVNKIDSSDQEVLAGEFFRLGIDPLFTISAQNGRKIGDLLDEVVESLGETPKRTKGGEEIRVAIVGVPNAGKSSIANRLLGHEKLIVTEIPGTTRDAVDSRLRYHGKTYVLVDTAGLRRKAKVHERIEYYSTLRTRRAIDSAHVVLLITDAERKFGKQDQHAVSEVIKSGKGLIVIVNKWDLIVKKTNTQEEYKKEMRGLFDSLENYPILFVSARTGQRISKLLPECQAVYDRWRGRVSTSHLNEMIREATDHYQPPSVKGKNIKLKYGTQVGEGPPHFVFFSNFPRLIPVSYKNYLENRLRKKFDLAGVPIRLSFRRS